MDFQPITVMTFIPLDMSQDDVSLFFQESESLFAQIVSDLLVLVLAVGGGLTCYKLQTVHAVKSDLG